MDKKVIAFVNYPGITLLDLVGPLQVLTGVAALDPSRALTTAVVADSLDPLENDTPAKLSPSATFDDVPSPYLVVVPGGDTALRAMADERLLDYLRAAAARGATVTSVCTGALVLGAAGLLEGRRATTHWAYTWMLPRLGAQYVPERWVEDGPIVTAAGVSAGIDMALHLAVGLAGEESARTRQRNMEYDPAPPLGKIDWTGVDRDAHKPRIAARIRRDLAGTPALVTRLLGQPA
jgi:transcriptional regulator GlxA family with amidase domain